MHKNAILSLFIMDREGVTAVTCNSCGMLVFLPGDVNNYTCSKCKLVVHLEEKVQQERRGYQPCSSLKSMRVLLTEWVRLCYVGNKQWMFSWKDKQEMYLNMSGRGKLLSKDIVLR